MGMTDLQFKSFLRKLLALLERAEKGKTREEVLEEIEALKKMLLEDIQG